MACREKFAQYIINPKNMYKVLWDVLMGFIYLVCYMIDPYALAFRFKPFEEQLGLNTF